MWYFDVTSVIESFSEEYISEPGKPIVLYKFQYVFCFKANNAWVCGVLK